MVPLSLPARALAIALFSIVGPAAAQERLKLFDAHLHYNAEPTPFYPLEKVLDIFRRNGIAGILATSRPNTGSRSTSPSWNKTPGPISACSTSSCRGKRRPRGSTWLVRPADRPAPCRASSGMSRSIATWSSSWLPRRENRSCRPSRSSGNSFRAKRSSNQPPRERADSHTDGVLPGTLAMTDGGMARKFAAGSWRGGVSDVASRLRSPTGIGHLSPPGFPHDQCRRRCR